MTAFGAGKCDHVIFSSFVREEIITAFGTGYVNMLSSLLCSE